MKLVAYVRIAILGLTAITMTAPLAGVNAQDSAKDDKPVLGQATIAPDGTITMEMFRTGDGQSAHAILTYKRDAPHYKEVLDHIGPIKPGQSRPVYPFDN